jgi:UDP-N-acetylmuramoyl-tripeptide--D-alanyl-D-alanine ligase
MNASMTTLAHIHDMLPGSNLLNISEEAAKSLQISSIGSDSRQVQADELFVALSGERFDAHQFLSGIVQAGASSALISDSHQCPQNLPAVCVGDTKKSLGQLAQAWRKQFAIPVAVVTGSNGKTTVKEMIASIFKAAVGENATLVTKGNLNNDIGLPLTLLRMRSSDRLAVIELGMNHPGETAELATVVQANIALINNAQREHQEFMTSVEAVANEHAAVLSALPMNGVAVFPADSDFCHVWHAAADGRRIIDFVLASSGNQTSAAVTGQLLPNGKLHIKTEKGNIEVQLNTLGQHNLRNALAASAVALAAGIELQNIQLGLESFMPVHGRMQAKMLTSNRTLIDDSYNANPDSVRAAIDALKQSSHEAWLVLGDMGEVGEQGPTFHQEVGVYAAQQGITKLFTLGEQCQFAVQGFNDALNKQALAQSALHFKDVDQLLENLNHALGSLDADDSAYLNILVKGSRFMRMERVVQALLGEAKTCS